MHTNGLTVKEITVPAFSDRWGATTAVRTDIWAVWAIALVISGCLLALLWSTSINHDTAWFLVATETWLNGAVLYEDIVEVNPPLNFYLTAPAVLLAEAIGVPPAQGQFLVISVVLAGVLGWSGSLLAGISQGRRHLLVLSLAVALVLPFLFSVAQREHVMLLLMTPWVIGRVVGLDNGHAARASVAALGLCLKPFFMLYPLALTLHEMVAKRSFRPLFAADNMVFLAAGVGYATAIALLHPQFFTEIVPIARHVYGEYGLNTASVLLRFGSPGLALGVCLVILAARRTGSAPLSRVSVLIGAAILIYLIQWTGYRYQFFPIASFVMLGLGWMLIAPGISLGRPLTFLALLALAMMIAKPVARGPYTSVVSEVLSLELDALGRGERLMSFSTSLTPGAPVALRNDLEWTSRYPALWLVPGAVDGLANTDCAERPEKCAVLSEIETRTRDAILSDLTERQPDILIFDHTHDYIDAPDFSWHGFLGTDPGYDAFLAGFVLVRDTRDYDIYLHRDLTAE